MTTPLAEMTRAELEAERSAADAARYAADYIDSYREWRTAIGAADDRLAAVTEEINRRDRARMENTHGER